MKMLLVTSVKGGATKTSTCRALAVSAAMDGMRTACLDLDPQGSLKKWWAKRPDDGVVPIDMYEGSLRDIEAALGQVDREATDLLIIDTPTSVEEYPEAMAILIQQADLIIVPTGASSDDIDSVIPWAAMMRNMNKNVAFLLSKVKPRTVAFREAKTILIREGTLVPQEVPDYEDVHMMARSGLSVVEVAKTSGATELTSVWHFARRELENA